MKASYICLMMSVFLVAGCAMHTTINEDGSSQVQSEIVLFNLDFEVSELDETQIMTLCPDMFQGGSTLFFFEDSVLDNATLSFRYDELYPETIWCTLTEEFDTSEELSAFYDVVADSYMDDSEPLIIETNFIGEREEQLIYDVSLTLPELLIADPETTSTLIGQDLEYVYWSVSLPGDIGENNADSVTDNRLEWRILQTEIYAETALDSTGQPADSNEATEPHSPPPPTANAASDAGNIDIILVGNLIVAITLFVLS